MGQIVPFRRPPHILASIAGVVVGSCLAVTILTAWVLAAIAQNIADCLDE